MDCTDGSTCYGGGDEKPVEESAGGGFAGPLDVRAALVRPGTSPGQSAGLLSWGRGGRHTGGRHTGSVPVTGRGVSCELAVGGAASEPFPRDAGTLCVSDYAGPAARNHAAFLERGKRTLRLVHKSFAVHSGGPVGGRHRVAIGG